MDNNVPTLIDLIRAYPNRAAVLGVVLVVMLMLGLATRNALLSGVTLGIAGWVVLSFIVEVGAIPFT